MSLKILKILKHEDNLIEEPEELFGERINYYERTSLRFTKKTTIKPFTKFRDTSFAFQREQKLPQKFHAFPRSSEKKLNHWSYIRSLRNDGRAVEQEQRRYICGECFEMRTAFVTDRKSNRQKATTTPATGTATAANFEILRGMLVSSESSRLNFSHSSWCEAATTSDATYSPHEHKKYVRLPIGVSEERRQAVGCWLA
ncbi:hypothetical protein HZH68_001087 [Vespula germanica]|uniref:Uncharacterized protein n=1 Tax=Vespula germanica TaxID=30212 RepID=A0A834NVE6_VESGE|nr:hypothetical protein HZH68_001087 [Vespula germanica]